MSTSFPHDNKATFALHLKDSKVILALCGAGLSAASGLPTFRGAGGLWRRHDAMELATPRAFHRNPGLVWQFYSYRRHMALQARPNPAHNALAELARRKDKFLTLTQNVDGLHQRAGHDATKLHLLHGSLFDVQCTAFGCDYSESNNFIDPISPALAIPNEVPQPLLLGTASDGAGATDSGLQAMGGFQKELDVSDDRVDIPTLQVKDLPHCPKCGEGLLRPGVVWFGEDLPETTLQSIDDFIDEADKIDLILVIGTSLRVAPAAGYVNEARSKGAKVAVINMDKGDASAMGLETGDWFFEGDAGVILPDILQTEIESLV